MWCLKEIETSNPRRFVRTDYSLGSALGIFTGG